jgi:hypothetical protein
MTNIFSSILDKLGIHKPAAAAQPPLTPTAAPTYGVPAKPPAPAAPVPPPPSMTHGTPYYTPGQNAPAPAPKPVEMPMVDVVSHLDYLAKTGPIQGLNWRMSINDLMALLGLPHTPQDIKDLAVELGCPEKEMGDSYSRNVWTHTTLLKKIAENGGNIPADLLK